MAEVIPETPQRAPLPGTKRERAVEYMVTASANLIDAMVCVRGSVHEDETRDLLQQLYTLEYRMRGEEA